MTKDKKIKQKEYQASMIAYFFWQITVIFLMVFNIIPFWSFLLATGIIWVIVLWKGYSYGEEQS